MLKQGEQQLPAQARPDGISDYDPMNETIDTQSNIFRAGMHLNHVPTNTQPPTFGVQPSGLSNSAAYNSNAPLPPSYPTGGYIDQNSEALMMERNQLIQQQELEFGINMYE